MSCPRRARLAGKENDASLNFAGSRVSSNRNLPQIPSVSRDAISDEVKFYILRAYVRLNTYVRSFVRYEKKNEKERGKKRRGKKTGKKIKRWRSEETTGKREILWSRCSRADERLTRACKFV